MRLKSTGWQFDGLLIEMHIQSRGACCIWRSSVAGTAITMTFHQWAPLPPRQTIRFGTSRGNTPPTKAWPRTLSWGLIYFADLGCLLLILVVAVVLSILSHSGRIKGRIFFFCLSNLLLFNFSPIDVAMVTGIASAPSYPALSLVLSFVLGVLIRKRCLCELSTFFAGLNNHVAVCPLLYAAMCPRSSSL